LGHTTKFFTSDSFLCHVGDDRLAWVCMVSENEERLCGCPLTSL
jgi:hypothetical protein